MFRPPLECNQFAGIHSDTALPDTVSAQSPLQRGRSGQVPSHRRMTWLPGSGMFLAGMQTVEKPPQLKNILGLRRYRSPWQYLPGRIPVGMVSGQWRHSTGRNYPVLRECTPPWHYWARMSLVGTPSDLLSQTGCSALTGRHPSKILHHAVVRRSQARMQSRWPYQNRMCSVRVS